MNAYTDQPGALDHDTEALLQALVTELTGRGASYEAARAAVRRAVKALE